MHSLEHLLKRLLLRLIGAFRSSVRYSSVQLPLDSFHRILIIRQHDQLGDLLIATPALRAVRKKFPAAYIAVVVREYTASIVEHNPNVDEVIIFYEKLRRWNLRRLYAFWRSLRSGFDCTIVLNTISRSFSSDVIALLSGAKFIVGPDHLTLDDGLPEKIYNVLVHRSAGLKHEIERNLDIVRALGADENDFEYDLVLTDDEVSQAERIFQSLKITEGKRIVGVHFGALNPAKCFPLDKLSAVIDWMIEKFGVEVMLIVSPNEIQRREIILSSIHHTVDSAPVMQLRVLAALMRHLELLLCNDTGTLHIASSQRVPTVSFHSMSDPAIWKPVDSRHIALRAEDAQITSITIQEVQSAVTTLLKKNI